MFDCVLRSSGVSRIFTVHLESPPLIWLLQNFEFGDVFYLSDSFGNGVWWHSEVELPEPL